MFCTCGWNPWKIPLKEFCCWFIFTGIFYDRPYNENIKWFINILKLYWPLKLNPWFSWVQKNLQGLQFSKFNINIKNSLWMHRFGWTIDHTGIPYFNLSWDLFRTCQISMMEVFLENKLTFFLLFNAHFLFKYWPDILGLENLENLSQLLSFKLCYEHKTSTGKLLNNNIGLFSHTIWVSYCWFVRNFWQDLQESSC